MSDNCQRCGHPLEDHVPFKAPGRKRGVCCGYIKPDKEEKE